MRNITFLFLAILGFRRKNLGGNRFSREICRSEKTLTLEAARRGGARARGKPEMLQTGGK